MNLLLSPRVRVLAFLFLFLQGLPAVDFTSEEKQWIASHPVVTLGSDYSWAPYDFVDKEGNHTGISEDFLQLIGKKSGLKFDVKTGVWADILAQMKEGEFDGLSCAVATAERKKYLSFSTPYMRMPLAIVIQDSRKGIKGIKDLKGKVVAVNKGSYLHEWLVEHHPEITLKLMSSNDASLEAVSFSKADAYIGNIAVATYIIKTHYLSNLKIVDRIETMNTEVSIAIAKDNTMLMGIIEKTLQSISSAERKIIRDKWISLEYGLQIDYTLVYQILAIFLLFILATWYWHRKLSLEVMRRKEGEAQMSMLIDAIPLSVIVSNFEGSVLRANTFALRTFDISASDMYHYNVMEFYANPMERNEIISLIQSQGKVEDRIVKFKRLDRSEMSVMISIIPIMYDGKKSLLSIMVDLTERIELEEHLREAKQSAEHANKAKSAFLANMSHEIRTPMNAIMGFTELLNEQMETPRLKSYTQTIKNAGTTLLTLINDILDLSKIEAGKLEINKKAVNVENLANEVSSIFSLTVSQKGLSLIVDIDEDIPKSLLIDGIRLRQVFVNLVGNAVKFTEEGYIKISIHAFNVDEHLSKLDLEISIEDTGIGIPEKQRERIFLSFEQQEGQDDRKFGGTGLGLSISKRLVEMMDGSIFVQSEEEKGATFFVYLYGVDISSTHPLEEEQNSVEGGKICFKPATLLIVDDIVDNRELIIQNFEKSAIRVITASDGLEAIAQYKKEKPDLILMDIRMPNMDGYEATSKIKQLGNVPIIALTASVMQDEYERKKSKDFDGYLRKPILQEDLFVALSQFLDYDMRIEEKETVIEPTFDSQMLEDMVSIKDKLDSEITPLYQRAVSSNNIADIQHFTQALEGLVGNYAVVPLTDYVEHLKSALDLFDIVEIQTLLKAYPTLIEHLKAV